MVELIGRELAGLRLGPPQAFRNLTMFPLLGGRAGDADYLTLDEALEAGTARVTEISESGSVPELRFQNDGQWAVLLLDGEELIGAKQNRVLNLSILAPAGRETLIPVSCVEAGRWSQVSLSFAAAPRAQYAAGRAKKMAAVSATMRRSGERSSDQHEVWEDIAAKADRLSSCSDTGAMAAMYDAHEAEVETFVRGLPPVEGQCGAVFAIGGELVGLDLFDHQVTLRKLLPKLVRSYGLDALDAALSRATPPDASPGGDAVFALLRQVGSAGGQAFAAVGEGEDLRLSGTRLTGGALVARERIIHLSAFCVPEAAAPTRRSAVTRISRPSARRQR